MANYRNAISKYNQSITASAFR